MGEGWVVKNLFFLPKRRQTPRDKKTYIIPRGAILYTEKALSTDQDSKTEELVYWAGVQDGDVANVTAVIIPKTDTRNLGVRTTHLANFHFVRTINRLGLIQIAQVHTHPGSWVDHSFGDDQNAAFKVDGLLSIVVPDYGESGMIPLTTCGVHRYQNRKFIRLSDTYILKHFNVDAELSCRMEDLRE